MEIREEREERQIRVFDLFISVCQRWRSLLICLVIGAVVLGAYGWFTSASGSPAKEPAEKQEDVEQKWEDVLGPYAMKEVEQLYETQQEYTRLSEEQNTETDLGKKLENMEHITLIQYNISSTRGRFTDDQKAYYSYLMGDTDIVPGNMGTYDHRENVRKEEEATIGRHIRKKYILVGAILGLILAAIVIIIKYVATSTIKTAAETDENLNIRILGRIEGSDRFYDKRKTALDRWLRRVKRKNKQKLSFEDSCEMVAAKIRIDGEKMGLKKVGVVVDSNVNADWMEKNDFLKEIAALTGDQPEIEVLDNILGRPDTLHALSETDGAVLVLQIEDSRFLDIQYERLLCEGYQIPVLGAIVVE